MSLLTPFGQNIWTIDGESVRMMTIPFRTRMTVVRLQSGGLWIHSPVTASADRLAAVQSLGTVEHLIAPNKFHHLFLAAWVKQFPQATTWAGPGVANRSAFKAFDHQLDQQTISPWPEDFEFLIFEGSTILPEAVFCHRPSATLILTDLIQNHDPQKDGWFWRTVKRLNGILAPQGGVPKDLRLTIRDKTAAAASVKQILSWEFDKIILSHGVCITQNGKQFFEDAFQWLR